MAKEDRQVAELSSQQADEMEAWLKAKDAPEPGANTIDRIIRDPEMPEGVGMKFASIKSAGYIYVYHTQTGDRSVINKNMLRSQLQKKLGDGVTPAFSLRPPMRDGKIISPVPGAIKCLLHADNSNRQHYTEMGFPICKKANITSQHALVQHMKHRHHVEWEAIEKERVDGENAENREFQKNLMVKLASTIEDEPDEAGTFVCGKCNKEFKYKKACKKHEKDCKGVKDGNN